MRKLVFILIGLMALFSLFQAVAVFADRPNNQTNVSMQDDTGSGKLR